MDQAETQGESLLNAAGLKEMTASGQPFVLATIHRAENTDDPSRLKAILQALSLLATNGVEGHDPQQVVLPLHPRTKARIETHQLQYLLEPLILTAPLGFLAMVLLERRASLVVTDSGGVQKEAFFQATPCVTVRTETEWVELLDCGWNKLADPTNSEAICNAIQEQLSFNTNQSRPELYGNAYAAEIIVSSLQQLCSP